jgi:hypothetical protein
VPNLEEESANKKTLIISDVHLVSGDIDRTNLFIRFCKNEAQQADQVFILGDLFNTWSACCASFLQNLIKRFVLSISPETRCTSEIISVFLLALSSSRLGTLKF